MVLNGSYLGSKLSKTKQKTMISINVTTMVSCADEKME